MGVSWEKVEEEKENQILSGNLRVPRINESVIVINGVREPLLYTPLPSWTTETEMAVAPALLNFLEMCFSQERIHSG